MNDRTASNRAAGRPHSCETASGSSNARADRLAAALRANLKRRKQQARARAADDAPQDASEDERR